MAWVAVDKNGEEWIYEVKPIKSIHEFWAIGSGECRDCIELPKGSIKKLIGRELTFEDCQVELK